MIAPTTMNLEVIDTEAATNYLALAAPNRGVRQGVVNQYARDMMSGKWHSSVLRFGKDGQLWDGQHRLWAVIESQTTQSFWVERGVSPDAVIAIDVGMKRTIGDILAIRGETSSNILAGGIRIARHLIEFPGRAPSGASRYGASTAEAVEWLDANPAIRDSVPVGRRVNSAIGYPATLAAGLHFVQRIRKPELADEFWAQMETGIGQHEDTGPYRLRQAIIKNSSESLVRRADQNMIAAVSIKAWNFWEYGRVVKQLRWHRAAGEAFPILGRKPVT